jgi:glutathione S-transferase
MEESLGGGGWLCGPSPTLADIALYAYSHTAGSRGGFDMGRFPHLTAWCTRMAALPGYVGLMDG